jgi:hypothetical protein
MISVKKEGSGTKRRRGKRIVRLYSIQGKKVWLLTTNELSKAVGVSARNLRKWEKRGILPKPPVTDKMKSPVAGTCRRRLYTPELVEVLDTWLCSAKPGRGIVISESLIQMLHEKWDIEVSHFKKFISGELDIK